jgi:hypothetical protein
MSVLKKFGSLIGLRNISGCCIKADATAVVPAFGAPTRKKFGQTSELTDTPDKSHLFRSHYPKMNQAAYLRFDQNELPKDFGREEAKST